MASGQPNSMASHSSTFMAVPNFSGVEIGVRVNGQLLELHRDPDEEGDTTNKAVRYIEVKNGQIFAIVLKVFDLEHSVQWLGDALEVKLTINNGSFGACNWYYEKERFAGRNKFTPIERVLLRNGNEGKPRFTAIVTDEDAASDSEELEMVKKLGCFTVKLNHAKFAPVQPEPPKSVTEKSKARGPVVKFSEKSMKGKAVSHTVDIVGEKPIREITHSHPSAIASEKVRKALDASLEPAWRAMDAQPTGSIEFRYRSREALEALCILPRLPAEQLSSSDIDAAQLPSSPPVLKKEKPLSSKMSDDLEGGDRPRKKARLADGKTS